MNKITIDNFIVFDFYFSDFKYVLLRTQILNNPRTDVQ
jgi:hypothetical protein